MTGEGKIIELKNTRREKNINTDNRNQWMLSGCITTGSYTLNEKENTVRKM